MADRLTREQLLALAQQPGGNSITSMGPAAFFAGMNGAPETAQMPAAQMPAAQPVATQPAALQAVAPQAVAQTGPQSLLSSPTEQARHQFMQMLAMQRAAPASQPQRQELDEHEMRAMLSPAAVANEEVMRGQDEEAGATGELLRNAGRTESAIRSEERADKQLADVKSARSGEQVSIDAEAVGLADKQKAQMEAIYSQGQVAADAQMKRVAAAVEDASQASLHNFWEDKSSGARILGVISQALAGAANALAGNPSAPTPLDRIISRDLEMQMGNLNQKNRNVENERGVLRSLYEQTGTAQQAASAMYIAAWKRIDLQGQQLASKYGTAEAQAGYDKLHAIAEQRISDATNKTYEHIQDRAIQQLQHGSNLLAETDAQAARGTAPVVGENAKIYHLAGVKGAVDDRTYKNFKEEDQNFRQFMKQGEHVDWLFKHGSGDNANDWQEFNSARSAMFSTLRQMQKTGAALSDAELKNAEAMLPSLAKGEVPGYAWITNARNQMQRIMSTAARGHFSSIDGTIEGVELDPNDSRYGHHVRNYYQQQAAERGQQEAAESQGE